MRYSTKENSIVHTLTFCVYKRDKVWFVDSTSNELYSYDLSSSNSKMEAKFTDEDEYGVDLFRELVGTEDKLYAVPFSANRLYEVSLTSGNIKTIEIDFSRFNAHLSKAKFGSAHKYKNSIYLVGATSPVIVEYNYEMEKLHYYSDWMNELQSFHNTEETAFFRRTILVDNRIYAPSCKGNQILEFNLDEKKHVWHEVGSERNAYSSICQQGDWFWLSPRGKGPIVKWNRVTKETIEIYEYPKDYTPCKWSFGDCIRFNDYIYFIPLSSKKLLRVSENTFKIECLNIENIDWSKSCACVCDECLYIYSLEKQQFVVLDKEDNVSYHKCMVPKEQYEYHKEQYPYSARILSGREVNRENRILEEYSGALRKYIDYVSKGDINNITVKHDACAKQIYDIEGIV